MCLRTRRLLTTRTALEAVATWLNGFYRSQIPDASKRATAVGNLNDRIGTAIGYSASSERRGEAPPISPTNAGAVETFCTTGFESTESQPTRRRARIRGCADTNNHDRNADHGPISHGCNANTWNASEARLISLARSVATSLQCWRLSSARTFLAGALPKCEQLSIGARQALLIRCLGNQEIVTRIGGAASRRFVSCCTRARHGDRWCAKFADETKRVAYAARPDAVTCTILNQSQKLLSLRLSHGT